MGGNIRRFRAVKRHPPILNQIAICRTEPAIAFDSLDGLNGLLARLGAAEG